jgi:hypothetical protein
MQVESPLAYPLMIRTDKWGDGRFGASRASGTKFHDGLDLVTIPTEKVFSMHSGTVEKYEQCYTTDPRWRGIQIFNSKIRTEIWYMDPLPGLVGKFVEVGQHIGSSQDISVKYNDPEKIKEVGGLMTPHIHVRLSLLAFTTIANGRYVSYEQYVDPNLFLGVHKWERF